MWNHGIEPYKIFPYRSSLCWLQLLCIYCFSLLYLWNTDKKKLSWSPVPHKTRGNKIGLRNSKDRRTKTTIEGVRGTKVNNTGGWDYNVLKKSRGSDEQRKRTGSWARIFVLLWSPGIDSKEPILSTYVAWAGWYENPIPTRFLAPIDCLKIPALMSSGLEK